MISIIVCSINATYLKNLEESIQSTIGVDYELIAMDNTVQKAGICKVYNEGGSRAKYPYLCFVHEDVKFHSQNWGEYLLETLKTESIGILGICGGKYYPNVPGGWLDIPIALRRFSMLRVENGNCGTTMRL
jgi:hypothetical protein